MKSLTQLVLAVACATPLLAAAQSATSPAVKPADQPRTPLESEQTTQNGQATKYGGPGTDTGGAMNKSGSTPMSHKGMKMDKGTTDTATKPGDAPTYPAPAKDGTPTK